MRATTMRVANGYQSAMCGQQVVGQKAPASTGTPLKTSGCVIAAVGAATGNSACNSAALPHAGEATASAPVPALILFLQTKPSL